MLLTFTRKEPITAVKVDSIEGLILNGEISINPAFVSQNIFIVGDYVSFIGGQAHKVWPAGLFDATFEMTDESAADMEDLEEQDYLDDLEEQEHLAELGADEDNKAAAIPDSAIDNVVKLSDTELDSVSVDKFFNDPSDKVISEVGDADVTEISKVDEELVKGD